MTNKLSAAIICAGVALAGSPALAGPAPVTGDPVLYWNEVMLANYGGPPWVTSRGIAMVDVAVHDAVNASLGSPNKSYLTVATPGGDTRAAASVAARNVLVSIDPAHTAQYDAALSASLALTADGAAKTNGIATGAAIASAAIANRANDGSTAVVAYAPSGNPGGWQPTPPPLAPAMATQWGATTPWLMTSGDQFRPGPPPALTSAEYSAAFDAVKTIGSAGSLTRTVDQTASAVFWAGATGDAPWIRAGIDTSQVKGLSTLDNAQLFARLATSVADATISVFDTKYYYDFWRPVTAIRLADLDGNAATAADPNWLPLIVTPPFPGYISAHAIVAGAASTVLGLSLGDANPICLTFGGNSRCWSSFSAAAADAAASREWGGIHWSFDNSLGLAAGQQLGRFDFAQSAFAAVPEPASWTMMIAGLGLIGGMIRRRRVSHRLA